MHYHRYKHVAKNKICQLTSEQRVLIVEQLYANLSLTRLKIAFSNYYNLNINIKTVYKSGQQIESK